VRRGGAYRVVVAGAGVAGLEAVLALRQLAQNLVDIEVLAPEGEFTYRALSVAEPFGAGEAHRFPLAELLAPQGARHRRDALAAVEADERRLTTVAGDVVDYEALIVACGGRPVEALPGALTFKGSEDRYVLRALVDDIAAGRAERVVFAVPSGAVWALPLYELALMTAARIADAGECAASLVLLTPEPAPLAIFGQAASDAVAALLAERGIEVVTDTHPMAVEPGVLHATSGRELPADRVVSLPRLEGPRIPGLPHDGEGFIPVTDQGAVRGVQWVYAAGDAVAFPIKQGGIAAQQAEAVAQVVAAHAGAAIEPRPFRPVVRGLLLTGRAPQYLRAEATSGRGETSTVDVEPLWWPPSKVAGRYLAPYLAGLAGHPVEAPELAGAVEVEVQL
jgi:sulfide:quinone oxidoreductase